MNIDVRLHVWRNESISQRRCLTCGESILRCPHNVLWFEETLPLKVPNLVQTILE